MIKKTFIFTILIISIWFILPQATQALPNIIWMRLMVTIQPVMALQGNPWKTIDYTEDHIVNGSTVYLRDGNYPHSVINRTGLNRSSWNDGVIWMPDTGHHPVIDSIDLGVDTSPENRYETFQNLTITNSATGGHQTGIWIGASSHVKILNCTISGVNAPDPTPNTIYLIETFGYAAHYSDITIDGCTIHSGKDGIDIVNNFGDIVIRNCNIYGLRNNPIWLDPGSYKQTTGSVLIENNHIHSRAAQTGDGHDAGIALRGATSNVTIRGNIIHGVGTTSGFCIYNEGDPNARCDNLVFENNLIYDPNNSGTVRFLALGTGVVIRNNTIVGTWIDNNLKDTWAPMWQAMWEPISSWSKSDSVADWSGVSFYNNAIIGCDIYEQLQWDTMHHSNNLYWALGVMPDANSYGWQTSSPLSDGSIILTNGSAVIPPVSDPTYFHTSGKMFVGSDDFNTYTMIRPTHYIDLLNSYKLASNSIAINAGESTNQPSDSLGSLDAEGFIQKNGPVRDATHHSAGAYEFASTSPPPPAIIYGDVNNDGGVNISDAALVIQTALGLTTLTSSQTQKGDVSGDGRVTAYDAALILQKIAGIITKFPVE